MSKCGMFSMILLILSGCASNCKIKDEVLGVLRRQNMVIDGLLSRRKQKNFQDQIAEYNFVSSEETLQAGLSAVVRSNNVILDGGLLCK